MCEGSGMLSSDELMLNLLKFALVREGISNNNYYISNEDREILRFGINECVICIAKYKGKWAVCNQSDRYNILGLAVHDDIGSACEDFWYRCLNSNGFYKHITAWERSTGLELRID